MESVRLTVGSDTIVWKKRIRQECLVKEHMEKQKWDFWCEDSDNVFAFIVVACKNQFAMVCYK